MSTSPPFPPKGKLLFSFDGEAFHLGDWVVLKSDRERDWVACIVEFIPPSQTNFDEESFNPDNPPSSGSICSQWAWHIDELKEYAIPSLNTDLYSEYEIIPCSDMDYNPVESIKRRVEVVHYSQFKQLKRLPFKSKTWPPQTLFWRQTFSENNGLQPPLEEEIVCIRPTNQNSIDGSKKALQRYNILSDYAPTFEPFYEFFLTPRNPDAIYLNCLRCHTTFDSNTNSFIEKWAKSTPENRPVIPALALQNKRFPSKPDKEIVCPFCMSPGSYQKNSGPQLPSIEEATKKLKSDIPPKKNINDETKSEAQEKIEPPSNIKPNQKVSLATEPSAKQNKVPPLAHTEHDTQPLQTQQIVEKRNIKSKTTSITNIELSSKPQVTSEPPSVAPATQKAQYSQRLLLKLKNSIDMGLSEMKKANLEAEILHHNSDELSTLIYKTILETFHDTKERRQRFYEISENLQRENNFDLRKKILTGKVSVKELVLLDTQSLAPESLQKEREEQRKRYFESEVRLRETDLPLIVKKVGDKAVTTESELNIATKIKFQRKFTPEKVESQPPKRRKFSPHSSSSSSSASSTSSSSSQGDTSSSEGSDSDNRPTEARSTFKTLDDTSITPSSQIQTSCNNKRNGDVDNDTTDNESESNDEKGKYELPSLNNFDLNSVYSYIKKFLNIAPAKVQEPFHLMANIAIDRIEELKIIHKLHHNNF